MDEVESSQGQYSWFGRVAEYGDLYKNMPFIVLSLILHTLQLKGKETPMKVECIDSHLGSQTHI